MRFYKLIYILQKGYGYNMEAVCQEHYQIDMKNTVTPLRITDKERSDTELEKQKNAYISGKKRKAHHLH